MVVLVPDEADAPDAGEAPELPPVVEADPTDEDGVENGDSVQLVRTGMVRFRIGDKTWRLRRPFFGELKQLRLAWQDVTDEIGDLSITTAGIGRQIAADYAELTADEGTSIEDRTQAQLALRKRDRQAGRQLVDAGDEWRIEWWQQVFDVLSVDHPDKRPEDFPAWFTNGTLPNKVLQHWRSVPLARG